MQRRIRRIRDRLSGGLLIIAGIVAMLISIADLISDARGEQFLSIPDNTLLGFLTLIIGLLLTVVGIERWISFEEIHINLNQITNTLKSSKIIIYQTRKETYEAAARIIHHAVAEFDGEKPLYYIGGLKSYDIKGITLLKEDYTIKNFEDEVKKCIQSSGSGNWCVRVLYDRVVYKDQLEEIVEKINGYESGDSYEVRITPVNHEGYSISPAVIGAEDALLGIRDRKYYSRVEATLHIHGREGVRFIEKYFERLWNDEGVVRLKDASGLNIAVRDKIEKALKERSS